jgi:hypothetical protein
MAITEVAYSEQYPNNTKNVTVDITARIPVGPGSDGDEKYLFYVSVPTNVYSDVTLSTAINPIYVAGIKRGWAQSHQVTSPVSTDGGTLTIAVDEEDSGAVSITVTSGSYSGSVLASYLQSTLHTTASGLKTGTSKLSYMNTEVSFEDNRFTLKSGSVKNSFNSGTWSEVSSVKVTGGTAADSLGFTSGYPNSYDLAASASGTLLGPASSIGSIDDAIRYGLMYISNQIDFSG